MRAPRIARTSTLALALALLAPGAGRPQDEAPAAAPEPAEGAGTAEGYFEVARERTPLHFAYVRGESGEGASGRLRLVIADRELPEEAVASASALAELSREDAARAVAATFDERGALEEVELHDPRLPKGVALRELARFVREGRGDARLEGRLLLDGEGTTFTAWFSAPIVRRTVVVAAPQEPAAEGEEASGDAAPEAASGPQSLAAALESGDAEAVVRLLAAGADPDERADRASLTPLMTAAGGACTECVAALIAGGARVTARTSSGYSALAHAVFSGRVDNVRLLLANGADARRDAEMLLKICDEKGFAEIRQLLVEAVASPAAAPKLDSAP